MKALYCNEFAPKLTVAAVATQRDSIITAWFDVLIRTAQPGYTHSPQAHSAQPPLTIRTRERWIHESKLYYKMLRIAEPELVKFY